MRQGAFLQTLLAVLGPEQLARDFSYAALDETPGLKPCPPLAVVLPKNKEALIEAVRLCLKHKVAFVARGAGTGKSGGAVLANGVVIDCRYLDRILSIEEGNLTATVEPGVILGHLQRMVAQKNLFYPPDPASADMCTIGGNVAENAAGPSTLKYGTTRDYVLGGEAILPTGEVIRFGKNTVKGVTGYDLASLLVGSEGTLAVFTELTLRLVPRPKEVQTALFAFADNQKAAKAVMAILQNGFWPRAIEYMDQGSVQALKKANKAVFLPDAPRAYLLVEVDSMVKGSALAALCEIEACLAGHGLLDCLVADQEHKRQRLWDMRKSLSQACSQFLGRKYSEDVVVPLGALATFVGQVASLGSRYGVYTCAFGHAGDGNLHVQILYDTNMDAKNWEPLLEEIFSLAVACGGTLSGEHGIGLAKKAYLGLEQSEDLIKLQKRIKYAFDPHQLLNPGKIFPGD